MNNSVQNLPIVWSIVSGLIFESKIDRAKRLEIRNCRKLETQFEEFQKISNQKLAELGSAVRELQKQSVKSDVLAPLQQTISDLQSELVALHNNSSSPQENRIDQFDQKIQTITQRISQFEQNPPQIMAEGGGRGPNLPIPEFEGKRGENFDQFIKRFNLAYEANGYKAELKHSVLAAKLKGKAFFLYDSLPAASKTSFASIVTALREKFSTQDHCRFAHEKFGTRKQRTGESVTDYGNAIYELGLAALSTIADDQRDSLIREKFLSGLLPHLSEMTIFSNPNSFAEALQVAERLEGVKMSQSNKESAEVATVGALVSAFNEKLERLAVGKQEEQQPEWVCSLKREIKNI